MTAPAGLARRSVIGWLKISGGLAAALFVPAGTLDFPAGRVYLALVSLAVAAIILYLWRHDRALLARRMEVGHHAESDPAQRRIMLYLAAAIPLPLLAGSLCFRMHSAQAPPVSRGAGDLLIAAGLGLIFLTFRANSFAAATVTLAAGQSVITGGPYRFVRHPMYSGLILILAATPLALGCGAGIVAAIPAAVTLAWRLAEEEKFLGDALSGYAVYRKQVRWRLIPYLY